MAVTGAAHANPARRRVMAVLPVVVVVAVLVLLMYPVALWLGLPLARLRMENVANWVIADSAPQALAEAPADPAAGLPAGTRLEFGAGITPHDPDRTLLVYSGAPVPATFGVEQDAVVLQQPVAGPTLEWGAELAAVDATDQVFQLPTEPPAALYSAGRVLNAGSVPSVERPDGVQRTFTFPGAAEGGPVLVDTQLLVEGVGFEADGERVTLTQAAPFNASVRRIVADYAPLDPAAGTIALSAPAAAPIRAATATIGLAEALVGQVDGANRIFQLQHAPLVESDPQRRIMLDGRELSPAAERPQERVDGTRKEFTFASGHGVVTVAGVEAVAGRDYARDGATIAFASPPARNAPLRQYPDYLILDPAKGTIELAVPPSPGSRVWAANYSYYDHPTCGTTEFECFLSMPQHPMPFPHWIASRIGPFFSAYPITDSRNVVRATLYTAGGTLTALLLGGLFGVLLAIVFVAIRPLERALLPWVIASQTVPIIALVPVLILLLGNVGVVVQTSLVPAAIIGAYIAFFPVTVGTVTGLRAVDPLSIDLMKSYAASPLQLFWKVRFPAAVPYLFVSLKLGAAAALVGALVAETESNNRLGLGYAIVGQVQAGNVSDVWILLLISAFLGIGLVGLVGLLQRFVAPWERR